MSLYVYFDAVTILRYFSILLLGFVNIPFCTLFYLKNLIQYFSGTENTFLYILFQFSMLFLKSFILYKTVQSKTVITVPAYALHKLPHKSNSTVDICPPPLQELGLSSAVRGQY